MSNFCPLVLFILSFSQPSILPDPPCLSRLSLLLPLHFTGPLLLHRPFLPNPPHPLSTQTALFYGHCSCVVPPSGDVNICSSACLKTSGGREILITAAVFLSVFSFVCVCVRGRVCVRARARNSHECVHMDFFIYECVGLCISVCVYCWFLQNNPDYTHLPVSHFRRKGNEGWGRKRVKKRRGRRDVLPPRQTPFIWTTESDQWFPPGVCCIGRPAAKAAFWSGNSRSLNSACKITLLQCRTGSFITYPIIFTVFIPYIFLLSIIHVCIRCRWYQLKTILQYIGIAMSTEKFYCLFGQKLHQQTSWDWWKHKPWL